jgi:beta-lactamase regulating signal transducer with metallopeptidase domain
MVPLIKLPLDLFLYDFSRWAYLQGLDPLLCEEGSRILTVALTLDPTQHWLPISSLIQFFISLPGDPTFTLADLVASLIPTPLLQSLSLCLVFFSFFFFMRTLYLYLQFSRRLSSYRQENPLFFKQKMRICVSSKIKGSPFVAGLLSPILYLPSSTKHLLSSKEYEAVLAHELEHYRYKDPLIRFLLHLSSSIFFWVPTKWLLKKMEEDQEIGSDHACSSKGIDPVDLACALHKVAKSQSRKSPLFAYHLTKYSLSMRISLLLCVDPAKTGKKQVFLGLLACSLATLLILQGRFWIF